MIPNNKLCPQCKKTKLSDEFYVRTRNNSKTLSGYCKQCTKDNVKAKRAGTYVPQSNNTTRVKSSNYRARLKEKCVDYKGGKCQHCDYDKYIGALEFHHIDPKAKEFSIGNAATRAWEVVKPELDKCIMLCANCHREEHARQRGIL